ncbi:PREDICTED: sodium/potassium-transporting ATPase subunit alpha-1-like [Rhagoletis zephyria]|uniref:sodium/potassium-transporting ATPase subunit alpha-1-like n=1 Tax=Rhagoletis zephyria TaxID=28612 RepID=UPI00081177D4|nr:PREDICTED: sodium/potassium-transporting ATPase subunit alpha-1-like [Rhagoletis zephyria]
MFKRFKNGKNKNDTNEPTDAKKASSKEVHIVEHQMTIGQVCAKYGTHMKQGLSEAAAEGRLRRDGPNTFTPPKDKPWYILFLKEISGGFALLLWLAAIGSFVSFCIEHKRQDAYLSGILVFTVLLTGAFSYYQQMSSSKVFKSFKNLTPQSALVLRSGKKQSIAAEQLVVGDIVFCQAGDRIPADVRVIQSNCFKVDNSSITGESEPILRTVEQAKAGVNALEATNLAFFSTNVTDGTGIGLVVATGDRTVMGDIAAIVTTIEHGQTPIAREISHFVKIISVLSVLSGAIFGAVYYGLGTSFFKSFLFMIGITVGNVPEGLLPALTVALTLTAKRMASRQCLVKHLEAVETLGSTSTICTDKTGTLTQNRMTVEHLWFGEETYLFRNGAIVHDLLEQEEIQLRLDWLSLKRCAMLCSRAEFLDDGPVVEERLCAGDASETAILKFLEQASSSVDEYRSLYPKVAEKPFNSTNKYQYSIHKCHNAITGSFGSFFLVIKGAPERLISLCRRRVNSRGNTVQLDEDFIGRFEDAYRQFGSQGERVLAFADLELPLDEFGHDYRFDASLLDETIRLENLRFLGLISMMDPPRPGVAEAVRLCRNAGIRVVMVTGDHPLTAQAIARTVNIISSSHSRQTLISGSLVSTVSECELSRTRSIVVPGDELAKMSEEQLQETLLLYEEIVFARSSPKQKLRIVEAFQRLGEIVAVTGDGVNDSPALKKADIGIAMGIAGSEVSKQAADMILLDDNFSTIVVGVKEGRRIFDNMKKTVGYILSGNVTTIYPFIAYATAGLPIAITTITALLIALGTDIVPAISLAYEKAEADIMSVRPRNAKRDRLVNVRLLLRAYAYIGVLAGCCAYVGYFVTMNRNGYTPAMLWQSRRQWEGNGTFPHWVYNDTTGQYGLVDTVEELLY